MNDLQDGDRDDRPVLLFFSNRRSGPARRMSSLVAWIRVTEKKRLRVVEVDADINPKLAHVLDVSIVPSLVLLRGSDVLGRLEGRVTGRQITRLIGPHVDEPSQVGESTSAEGSVVLGRSAGRR